jgi:hypothetical protein
MGYLPGFLRKPGFRNPPQSFLFSAERAAMSSHRSESDSAPIARFAIQAWSEADVLPRILAPIVKRGLVPLRFDSLRDGEHLRVHVEVEGMKGDEALRLAATFRQIVNVQSVVSAMAEGADEAPVPAALPVMRQMQAEISG